MSTNVTTRPSLDDLADRMNQLIRERDAIDAVLDPIRHDWQRESLHNAATLTRAAHPHAAYAAYFHEDDVLKFSTLLDADQEPIDTDHDTFDELEDRFPVLDTDTPIHDLYADLTNGRWDPCYLDLTKILSAPPAAY